MPIDHQIPLQVNQLNLPATLGAATQNALREVQLKESQQELQSQNALRNVFSQPGSIDPQSGMPTADTVRNVLSINPQYGVNLINQMENVRMRKDQEARTKALTDQAMENTKRLKQEAALRVLPVVVDRIYAPAAAAADEAAKNGQDPWPAAQKQLNESLNNLVPTGILQGQEDDIRNAIGKMNLQSLHNGLNTARSYFASQKQENKPVTPKWVDDKGVVYGEDPTGKGALSFYNTLEGDRGWKPVEGRAPTLYPIGQTPAAGAEKATAKSDATAVSGMSPEDIDSLARQARAGDKTVFQNLGRGVQGAKNIEAIRHRMTEIMIEAGDTPEEQAARNAEFAGITAGERTVGVREANIQMAATEAKNMIPLALKASEEANRAGIKSVNDLVQFAQGKTASPELRRLSVATNGLINVYARAISPTGVPTVSDKDHAREILDKGFASGDYAAAVDQIRLEIEQAQKSPGQVRQQMRESITGKPAPAAPSGDGWSIKVKP